MNFSTRHSTIEHLRILANATPEAQEFFRMQRFSVAAFEEKNSAAASN